MSQAPAPAPPAQLVTPPGSTAPRWSSNVLLGGLSEVRIAHQGTVYTLRLTATGKLILTK